MCRKFFAALAAGLLAFTGLAADRLAVAEPAAKGGIKSEEVEAIWNMLEASVNSDEYELVSRAALKQMLTEIGLTDSSGLVNLNSAQKAKLGELKTVKYLLISTVARFGSRLNLSLMVLDASTGEIDPGRKGSLTVNSLDELADKLNDTLQEIGLRKAAAKRGISAILVPVVRVPGAPMYLGETFNVRLEAALLEQGIKLQNLQSVAKILDKNHIDNLYEAEPAMFVRIGELLRVDNLIQATFTRFSCDVKSEYIAVTRKTVVRRIGNLEGNVRIVSARTGEVAAVIPFARKIDFDDLSDTEDWTGEDYGKYLIEKTLPEVCAKVVAKVK